MSVRWLTGFIDRPAGSFETAVAFWCAITGSTLSPRRGDEGEFATFLPPDGDPYLRIQRVRSGPGGSHLDLHVDDVTAFARRAVAAGAEELLRDGDLVVLRSPAGLPWCAVGHHGEQTPPAPQPAGETGGLHLVDQVCIDIPASGFEQECAFWSAITGWEHDRSSVRPEFADLTRPVGSPLRLLLQRREDDDGPARAHIDVSSTDVERVVAHHVDAGATFVEAFDHWTVLTDPSGIRYCVTARDPRPPGDRTA